MAMEHAGELVEVLASIFCSFLLVLAIVWLLVCYLLSQAGGWRRLASDYGNRLPYTGKVHRGVSGLLRGFAQYRSALVVGVDQYGLRLEPVALFKPFHSPLCLPWSDLVGVRDEEVLKLREVTTLTFRKHPTLTVSLARSCADWVRTELGGHWPMAAG